MLSDNNIEPGTPSVVATANWSQSSPPVELKFFIGNTPGPHLTGLLSDPGSYNWTINTSGLAPGTYTIKVLVSDTIFTDIPATSTLTVAAPKALGSVVLSGSPLNGQAPLDFVLTAITKDTNGNPLSGVSVTFQEAGNPIISFTSDVNGQTIFNGTALSPQTYNYNAIAVYGNVTLTSNTVPIVVTPPPPPPPPGQNLGDIIMKATGVAVIGTLLYMGFAKGIPVAAAGTKRAKRGLQKAAKTATDVKALERAIQILKRGGRR